MDNPYAVVPSPTNYAAPMVDLFGNNKQQGQQQGQQQGKIEPQAGSPQQLGQSPAQQFGQGAGSGLAALLKKMFGLPQTDGAVDPNGMQKGPITPTQMPDQPISNFNPNTTGSLY